MEGSRSQGAGTGSCLASKCPVPCRDTGTRGTSDKQIWAISPPSSLCWARALHSHLCKSHFLLRALGLHSLAGKGQAKGNILSLWFLRRTSLRQSSCPRDTLGTVCSGSGSPLCVRPGGPDGLMAPPSPRRRLRGSSTGTVTCTDERPRACTWRVWALLLHLVTSNTSWMLSLFHCVQGA